MSKVSNPRGNAGTPKATAIKEWTPVIAWGLAFLMVLFMVILLVQRAPEVISATTALDLRQLTATAFDPGSVEAPLPEYPQTVSINAIVRDVNAHTIIPTRLRTTAVEYTVQKGDSIFSISNKYKLKPESILWANYDLLQDNPNMLSVGQKIIIPPVDGIYYKWQENDKLEDVAARFKADVKEIISFSGNKLDMTNPVIKTDSYVMIPGGSREFKQWVVPMAWRPSSGANKGISGPGGCELFAGGAYGTGSFLWPTSGAHVLSGNDFWSGHLGIDIAAGMNDPVMAADTGVVIYAGVIGGGYGNMVMIDHGNGYQTLYAHLNSIAVGCGQSVSKGQAVGYAGNTGNSTGVHLHFEVRYQGGFINPWYVLN